MDQYFVVGADGTEFGPTDLPGLIQWVREGRVLRETMIRKAGAAPVQAASLPELGSYFSSPPPVPVPPAAGAAAVLPAEFRVWDFIVQAWELVKPHWLPLAGMSLLAALISSVPLVGLVVRGPIYVGMNRAILGMMKGQAPDVGMMFNGFDRFLQAFLLNLVFSVAVGFGMMLCLVPGLILATIWMFGTLILAETDLDFWPALEASVALTAGYRWQLFFLLLANILVAIAGLLVCCVGIFIAQPVMLTAIALAYRFVQAHPIAKPA